MKPVNFDLAVAQDVADARRLLAAAGPQAKLMAGGQSLGAMLNLRLVRPAAVVELSRAHDLRGATEDATSVAYGAAVTHAEVEDGAVPDATPGWMASIARGIAYRAVRNRGTIGGSLAHADPAADWIVTMTALAAEIVIANAAGSRRVAMQDFMTGPFATVLQPDEILTAVRVPRRRAGARFGYWKYARKIGEFAKASAAVLVDETSGDIRIVVGAIEAPPILLPDPEAILADPTRTLATLQAVLPDRPAPALTIHALAVTRAIARLQAGEGRPQ
jgi:carbon-monoxide dehydrogenase medium subunit